MASAFTRTALWTTALSLLAGCSGNTQEEGEAARVEQAVNVCNVTVAANLIVDGIPAYDQCSASSSAAIYSNNGVDTATTAVSSDWKRTQFSGGYQCTELLHRYWMFRWNIDWEPNGDAGTWCDRTPPSSSGIVQTTTPVHGDAMVFGPGVCGSGSVGHVTLIDTVDTAASKATFIEQNSVGRRTAAWSCASCFLHVVANDGSAGAPNTGGTGGTSSTANSTALTGGRPSTGGRSASGGTSTAAASGGSQTVTGGRAATGGHTASGGSFAMGGAASGGAATGGAPTGGRTAGSGGRPATGGAVADAGGTSSTAGTATVASGGSTRPATTSSTKITGGASAVQTSSVYSDTGGTGNSTGGAESSSPSAAGSSTEAANTTAVAGQSSVGSIDTTDPGSCSCKVPNGRSSTPAGLGIASFTLLVLLRLRKRRT